MKYAHFMVPLILTIALGGAIIITNSRCAGEESPQDGLLVGPDAELDLRLNTDQWKTVCITSKEGAEYFNVAGEFPYIKGPPSNAKLFQWSPAAFIVVYIAEDGAATEKIVALAPSSNPASIRTHYGLYMLPEGTSQCENVLNAVAQCVKRQQAGDQSCLFLFRRRDQRG